MTEDRDTGSGARTITLLKIIAAGPDTFTLGSLTEQSGFPASSVHRLLQPLQRSGLVERGHGQTYRAGSEFLRMAALLNRKINIGHLAKPILRKLWEEWEETCSLCEYRPATHMAVVVETIQTPHPLRFVIEPYAELSLAWGSLGRAILAWLSPSEVVAATERPDLSPLSGSKAAPPDKLETILEETRLRGFAYYRNEELDAAGIAAPIHRGDGSIFGSLGITAPARRISADAVPQIALAVTSSAKEISALLGYHV